jgi:hypothetical protein
MTTHDRTTLPTVGLGVTNYNVYFTTNGLQGVNWPAETIDFVSGVIHISDPVTKAKESLDSFSKGLPTVGKVVLMTVVVVDRPAGITTGAVVLVAWNRVRVTTVTGGRDSLKIEI